MVTNRDPSQPAQNIVQEIVAEPNEQLRSRPIYWSQEDTAFVAEFPGCAIPRYRAIGQGASWLAAPIRPLSETK